MTNPGVSEIENGKNSNPAIDWSLVTEICGHESVTVILCVSRKSCRSRTTHTVTHYMIVTTSEAPCHLTQGHEAHCPTSLTMTPGHARKRVGVSETAPVAHHHSHGTAGHVRVTPCHARMTPCHACVTPCHARMTPRQASATCRRVSVTPRHSQVIRCHLHVTSRPRKVKPREAGCHRSVTWGKTTPCYMESHLSRSV